MAIETFNLNDSGSTIKDNLNANFSDLDTTKADLASPAFTGNPTAPTQTAGDNSTKLATTAYVANQITASGNTITIETTSGSLTHSLTTIAGQKVVVWASGVALLNNSVGITITLAYNGVAKHEKTIDYTGNGRMNFDLMYTETPGADTQDITLTIDGGKSFDETQCKIIVMKIG
jgi:hypothetical protein